MKDRALPGIMGWIKFYGSLWEDWMGALKAGGRGRADG